MPKKSNKTAHVLSILTSGVVDLPSEPEEQVEEQEIGLNPVPSASPPTTEATVVAKPYVIPPIEAPSECVSAPKPAAVTPLFQKEASKTDVIVEMQGASGDSYLSDLVRADLEKELTNQINAKTQSNLNKVKDSEEEKSERPPYSSTFMAKFGIDLPHSSIEEPKEEPRQIQEEELQLDEQALPTSLAEVTSEAYVLETFDDDEVEIMENTENNGIPMKTNNESSLKPEETKVLRNLAEEVVRTKTPAIMQGLNMCICPDCVFDVIALALNNIQPLYTVTERGQLFQKLASYETQYGTDLTSEITKACIRVKCNPNHHTVPQSE